MDGKDCRVHRDVERVLKEFHEAGKPIGCVAGPLLLPPGGSPGHMSCGSLCGLLLGSPVLGPHTSRW